MKDLPDHYGTNFVKSIPGHHRGLHKKCFARIVRLKSIDIPLLLCQTPSG